MEEVSDWDHDKALVRAERVEKEFRHPVLKPFDTEDFWGSWKWIGCFATDCTWVGRLIMASLIKGDPRGIPHCIDWLSAGPSSVNQGYALRYALHILTGMSFANDREWIDWYRGDISKDRERTPFRGPEIRAWVEELKIEYNDLLIQ